MKRGRNLRHEAVATYLIILIILGGAIVFLHFADVEFTGYAVYMQSNQSAFDQGTYSNTEWNGSAVVLSSGQTSGAYTSEVFDAGNDATWNNLSWQGEEPTATFLYGVDGAGDVYNSLNGAGWTQTVDNYGRTTSTTDIFSNNDYLFILSSSGNEVWRSDEGQDFIRVYSGFSGSTPFFGKADSNGNLYVVTGPGEFWTSTDNGISWTYLSDVNPGVQDPKGMVIDSDDYIYVVDGAGDVYQSTNNGMGWTKVNDGYGGSTGTDGMAIDNDDNLYISLNKEIYRSDDLGASWTVVNDSFSTYANDGCEFQGDNIGNLYAVDCVGRVFKSGDSGVTWSEEGDMNGGGSSDPKGIAIYELGNGPKSFTLVPTHAEDEFGGDITSSVNVLDGTDTWERVEVQSWDSSIPSLAKINSVIGHCDVLWIDPGAEIGFQVSRDSGQNWDSEVCVQSAAEGTDFTCDLKANSGVDTGDEVNNLMMRCTQPTSGAGDFYSVDFAHVEVNYNYSAVDLDFAVRNCSASDCSGDSWTVPGNLGDLNLQSRYFQYMANFTSIDSSLTPSIQSVTVDYDLVNTAPSLNLISPQEGATYGYNESLPLNLAVSDIDGNLDSCWYSIDGGDNVSISSCQNTTFDVSGDGNYQLNLYANDSLGFVSEDTVSFNVQIGSPTIELAHPMGVYLQDYDITFRYTPTDIDLESCQLWGNFDGTFKANQTDTNPSSGVENTFDLTLTDGVYLWNVWCNDSIGNSAFNGNKTFYIDTVSPQLALTEPVGDKSSRTVSAEWTAVDDNLDSCWYRVYRGETLEKAKTIVNCNSGSTDFDVTLDADFVFNFYVNDSAGNSNSSNLSFSVDTSSPPSNPPPSSSGGGGGSSSGGGGAAPIVSGFNKLEIGGIQNLIMNPGDSKKLTFNVRNAGTNFLNDCGIEGGGEFSSWIGSGTSSKDLAAGEEYGFSFDLTLPDDIGAGVYNPSASIKCKEANKSLDISVEIIERKLIFELINVERESNDLVKVVYSIEEASNIDQNVEMQFLLFNTNNEEVAEINENKTVAAGSKDEFETLIPIDKSLEGEFNLLINLNSETYSTFVQENIVLGSAGGISGFSVFGNETDTDSIITVLLILLFLVFAFFIVRRILKHRVRIKRSKLKY